MASSSDVLSAVIGFLDERPKVTSIMDLGCGQGNPAFYIKRAFPDLVIDGVDAFPRNVNVAAGKLNGDVPTYRSLVVGKVEDQVFSGADYSIVLALELFDKMDKELAIRMIHRYSGNLLASFPYGEFPQGPLFGNPYEERRSFWHHFELEQLSKRCVYRGYRCGLYWM